ncbi:RagB/SusD family nutrient uptake outer membrane protein [Ferruginibacter sp.]|nr:RagB/SusD family nutrient uptake outer membrane protein [Ferruginibacter sp.]
MKFYKLIFTVCFLMSLASCKKYLNVSDELAGGLTSVDQVFDNPDYAKRFYANVMSGVPDYSMLILAGGITGLHNPWACMTDEVDATYGDAQSALNVTSPSNSSSMRFQRWSQLYQLIRQANIFLEKAKVIPPSGISAAQLDEVEFKQLKTNVIFMRAYYHYLLFEQYGPVPILDRSYSPTENLDLPRNSVDEVVKFISDELDKAIPDLPQSPITVDDFKANPTKGVALAVKAKLWMYAASPLLNGGFAEAVALTDPQGKKIFPAADPSKWQKALAATKAMVDYAVAGNYALYVDPSNDPNKSVYELFQKYTNEIIWARIDAIANSGWGGLTGDRLERRNTPRSEPNGLGSTSVVQDLVDDFYMKDGLPINNAGFLSASPLYSEQGFSAYNSVQVYNMFINREPRFYNTVFFAGRKWHVSNRITYFHVGTPNDRSGQSPANGYLMYKRNNIRVSLATGGVSGVARPSIIFRLAEFYLLYAEALNEVEPGNPDVLKYVNLVRKRAGIPDLQILNPAIIGNKDLQRAAIQRESRIELATEGQRYFDVRRWMICERPEGNQGGDFFGMDMNGNATTFYTRTKFQTRVFDRSQYLYPIPFIEMQKSNNVLVQNPGW